tara:strand:+ start:4543 stop:4818 length:276 start_codon:yes stop_codon:yes gene_type:complete
MEGIKSITEAMRRLSQTEDYKKVLDATKNFLHADEPSAPVAKFDPHQTMYLDGHKAVFRHFEKLERGDYLDESRQDEPNESFDKFTNQNQL